MAKGGNGGGKGGGKPVDDGYPGNPVVLSFDNSDFPGTDEQDVVYGGPGTTINVMYGGAGNDYFYGEDGDDFLYGEEGNDVLLGGAGADSMFGGEGDDKIQVDKFDLVADGGNGVDTLAFQYSDGAVDANLADDGSATVIDLASGEFYEAEFISFENLIGSEGDDILTGNKEVNHILGSFGSDTIYGMAGDDFLYAQDGNDTLIGGEGMDTFYNDGNGGNTLTGGNEGGTGDGEKDTFHLSMNGFDTILDFEKDIDILKLRDIKRDMNGLTFEVDDVDNNGTDDTIISWGKNDQGGVILLDITMTEEDWSAHIDFL